MAAPTTNDKIILNFGWIGSSSWQGGCFRGGLDVGVVDLLFKNAKTEISVNIPDNISVSTIKRLPFTCRKPFAKETHPDSLIITIEKIRSLTVKAGIFEESPIKGPAIMDSLGKTTREKRILRSDREIKLEVPEVMESGQTYSLIVTSNDFSFSARLLKEEKTKSTSKNEEKDSKDEFQSRMKKMGEALIREGMQNLNLDSKGEVDVFNSSNSTSDIFAHGMQGIIRSGQQIHPEIRVPYTKPSESSLDLDTLSTDELQSRFEMTFKKDKEFETQRMQAAIGGDIKKMNKIIELEHANSQLLIKLAEALEKKGVSAQIPQSESFQSAANQSTEAHAEALKQLNESCKMQ